MMQEFSKAPTKRFLVAACVNCLLSLLALAYEKKSGTEKFQAIIELRSVLVSSIVAPNKDSNRNHRTYGSCST